MKPYHWAFIGLTLDIIGAFLLAVEAIKIDNLRKLKIKFLRPIHKATLSPKIRIVEDNEISSANRFFMWFYNGLHYLAGILLLIGVNYIINGRLFNWAWLVIDWVSEKPWYVIILASLVFLLFGIFAGLWMLGELVHMAITQITRLSVIAVNFIDAKTPNGTTGIIGFLLLLLGFLIQMLAAYLSGNPN